MAPNQCTDCGSALGDPVDVGEIVDVYNCPECGHVHYVGTVAESPEEFKARKARTKKASTKKASTKGRRR